MTTDGRRPRGTVLEGRYRMEGVLARGGMSTVHRGMDLRLRRPVAIKVMTPELARDPAFVRRFEREARAAARLAHPGIVAVHDQGHDADGTVFLVLELVEGGTLRDVLRREGRLRPATALTVVEQIVTALRVAHTRGLVHRDVKPENVLVGDDGSVKVADFGLVGAARPGAPGEDPDDPADDGPGSRMLLGTAAYLAPEQVARGHSDERTDLYSAGIVLYELLTGVPPHTGGTALDVARRHVHADVPPPSLRVAGVPAELDRLVLALTDRDPARRPRSAGAVLAAARAVHDDAGLPFSPVTPPGHRADTAPDATPGGANGTFDASRRPNVPFAPAGGSAGSTVPPPRGAPTGTRRLDVDDPELDPLDDDPAGDPTGDDLLDGPFDEDDLDGGAALDVPRSRRTRDTDDVDDRIERLARRRARTRSRRWFAVWTVLVAGATVAAGSLGWALGLPG